MKRLGAIVLIAGLLSAAGAAAPRAGVIFAQSSPASDQQSSAPATPPSSGPAAAAAPTGTPAVPAETQAPSAAPAAAASMDPADVRALLYKVYTTAYRVTDLASTIQPESLKISDQDRASLSQKLDALRAALAALEKPRGDFYNHPESLSLGQETISALKALLPQLDDFRAALSGSLGAAQANDYQQPSADLAGLESRLEPYVSYLQAKESPSPAARGVSSEMKTEQIQPAPVLTPLTTSNAAKPPLDPAALKQLLYSAYVPTYRIKDLLGQEHPERWHASAAEQGAFNGARQELETRLAELETWRGQFAENPQSLEFGFETYRALWSVTEPLDALSRIVRQSEDPKLGAEYADRGQEIAQAREKLVPYLSYLLHYHDQTTQAFQQDLVGCENQLGYAMRPRTEAAVPMKNINPVFQGRRVREREANSKANGAAGKPKKKSTKPSASPAQ